MFTVREATEADAEATARVHTRSWQTSYRGLLPDAVLDGLDAGERAIKRHARLERGVGLFLVGCDDATGEIVGFCDAGPHREQPVGGEVYAIYLLDEAKGTGLGRALFERALAWLRERAMVPVTVWVFEDNPRARRFYEVMGGELSDNKDIVIQGHTRVEVAYVWR